MYGGLFGDLPEASNSKGKGSTTGNIDESAVADSSCIKNSTPDDTRIRTLEGPQRQDSQTASSSSSSVVKSLGATRMSMAFIPAAARRRKPPPQTAATPAASATTTTTTTTTKASNASCAEQAQRENSNSVVASSNANPTDATARTLSSINVEPFQVVHAKKTSSETGNSLAAAPIVQIHQQHDNWTEENLHQQQHGENEEPESLRRLHEQATEKDPYDPMFPNDLLQYWESKAFEKERKRLEKEHRESVEQQEKLRKQLEKEREELVRAAAAEGNLASLAQHHQNLEQQQRERQRAMSGGRGRGLSNLPAWLVEKQRQEARSVGDNSDSDPNKRKRQRLNDGS